jgi:hypothetical protein
MAANVVTAAVLRWIDFEIIFLPPWMRRMTGARLFRRRLRASFHI